MAHPVSATKSRCPFGILLRVLYVHFALLWAFVKGSHAYQRADGTRVGCPLTRATAALTAFQQPFTRIYRLFEGSSAPVTSSASPGTASPPAVCSLAPSAVRKSALCMSAVADRTDTKAANQQAEKSKADKQAEQDARKMQATEPLEVHVIGLSHHNAAVEIREKLAVPEADWNLASAELCESPNVAEAAVLSTCNRFEVYIASHNGRAAIREAIMCLQRRSGLPQSVLRRSLFMLSDNDAVWHVLRVSAGLDSLVVGEGQILSQVRQCYLHGTEEGGSAGKVVSRLLNTAVSAGKRVRSETSISKGAVSISSAAAEFSKMRAQSDLGMPFEQAKLAIVGAGKMTRLLIVHLGAMGVRKVTLVNRSMPKCLELQAEFPDMEFDIRLSDTLEQTIMESDIVYTSTSATGCIVTKEQLTRLRGADERPVMFVDISVPRNVESECNEVVGVFAYDVDDLKMVVARNTALRRREMLEAEGILEEELSKFRGWQQSLTAIPAIAKLQDKFEQMRADEVRKAANKLSSLDKKQLEVVEKLSKGIVNKMLHGPMSALRQPEGEEAKKRTLKILRDMFKLEKL